ncbi:hypothetical protein ACOME3_000726 [Neoechinorhynchus agilis]
MISKIKFPILSVKRLTIRWIGGRTEISKADYHLKEAFKAAKKLEGAVDKRQFLKSLSLGLELDDLSTMNELMKDKETNIRGNQLANQKVTFRLICIVFLYTGLPYIGFGFADNFLMIIFGDMIEQSFKATFATITPLAAAALGNTVSDGAGVTIAHRVEELSWRFLSSLGIVNSNILIESTNRLISATKFASKLICVTIGCLIGMVPLLWITESKDASHSESDRE